MTRKIIVWECIGILFIISFGTSLHFLFEWTDYFRPIAIIAAVNESTWEHFKMAFWPGLFFSIIEWSVWGKKIPSFFIAKFMGLLLMPILTAILFYGYTLFWHHSLPADILVFILSVVGGQFLSMFIIIRKNPWFKFSRYIGISGLLILITLFSLLSYFPGNNFLFTHPETGEHGILSEYANHDHEEDH